MTMSNENSRFAVELRSACARIQQMVVPHLYFRQAKQRLLEALDTSNLVLLVGPSAVGKGTLIRAVIEKFNAPVERNPKAIRAITVRAPSPQSSRFPWKAFWIACLDAMFDPLPERKVSHGPLYKQSDSIDILKRAVFSAVRDRGVKLIVVDEAMNLVMKERGGQTLRSRLDVLRDISDEAGCAFLLVSTPRILEPLELSCELARRMREEYFRPYTFSKDMSGEHYDAFRHVTKAFVDELPEKMIPKFSSLQIQLLQAGSAGCVGHLSAWFVRAVIRCMWSDSDALEWRHFEETILSDGKLKNMRQNCEGGERDFQKLIERTYEVLRGKVGEGAAAANQSEKPACNPSPGPSSTSKRHPGKPKPNRHRRDQ